MKSAVGFLIFVAGAAIGSAATWYYTKDKYARIAQEEIDSVKEKFSSMKKKENPEKPKAEEPEESMSVADYAKQLSKKGYTMYSNADILDEEEEKVEVTEIPFVIPPEEFGNLETEGYSKICLTYYSDGVLTDEDDEIVEDVDAWVGKDSLDHFGEYDDDVVYVRNHRLKVDYEIILSQLSYEDILEEKPYLRRYDE